MSKTPMREKTVADITAEMRRFADDAEAAGCYICAGLATESLRAYADCIEEAVRRDKERNEALHLDELLAVRKETEDENDKLRERIAAQEAGADRDVKDHLALKDGLDRLVSLAWRFVGFYGDQATCNYERALIDEMRKTLREEDEDGR